MIRYENKYRIEEDICYIDCINSKGELKGTIIIDTNDIPLVKKYNWHIENSRKDLQYAKTSRNTKHHKTLRMHRLFLPTAPQVDHINHNGLDNRRCNLRACNNRENNCNKDFTKNSPLSGHTGIRFNPKVGSYYVRIMVNKKEVSLGHYKSLEAAIEARKQGEIEYFGDFRYKDTIMTC